MIVERSTKICTEELIEGDIISFKLTDGEEVEALAVKKQEDGVLFATVDCLAQRRKMFECVDDMNDGFFCYENSDLRKALNGEIFACFPEEIRSRMVAVNADGDMLRIPTECEIFGYNVYGKKESKTVKRWLPMNEKRNRIAFRGREGAFEWYWLMNQHKKYDSCFAIVDYTGNEEYPSAFDLGGVRPVFLLGRC